MMDNEMNTIVAGSLIGILNLSMPGTDFSIALRDMDKSVSGNLSDLN